LRNAASDYDPMEAARTVVTVPASFQTAQRLDGAFGGGRGKPKTFPSYRLREWASIRKNPYKL
jgi:hypothetical protein